jgi:hypothetical protein
MISDVLRRHRRGSLGVSWYVDETYVKVGGQQARCSDRVWQPIRSYERREGDIQSERLGEHLANQAAAVPCMCFALEDAMGVAGFGACSSSVNTKSGRTFSPDSVLQFC